MHLKRHKIPTTWPLSRKGTKYLVRPSHGLKNSIPLLIVLRDILKLVKNRKEAKKLLNLEKVKINNKKINEEKFPLTLFDNFTLGNKNFRINLKNKKFGVEEISEKEAEEKISKVIGKKIFKGKRIQINLSDGRNYLVKEKVKVGDSVIINLKENKISQVLEFKEGNEVIFTSGKHISKIGEIEKIDEKKRFVIVDIKKEKINAGQKSLMVIK